MSNSVALIFALLLPAIINGITIDNRIAAPEIVFKASQRKVAPRCKSYGKPLDLLLIMDGSGSLRQDNDEVTKVLTDLVNIVAVSQDATRVAFVQYSGIARSEFHFNSFNDKQQILDAVKAIKPLFGVTRTGNALKHSISELDPEKGMRGREVPKIAFLISDGRTQDYPDDGVQAANLRAKGIPIWAYGLGEYVAIEELANVTGDVNKVVTRKNYPLLKQLFENFKGVEVCEEVPICVPGSNKPLDLMFVIDGSESVEDKFREEMNFVLRVLNNIIVHRDAVRVALIVFSSKSTLEFDFRKYQSNDQVRQHVLNMVSKNGTTKTQLALDQAYDVLSENYGARNDSVKKLVIVLTDGHSQVDPSAAAKRLTDDKKAIIFAVALVPLEHADTSELLSIANNDPDHVFTRLNMDQFEIVFKNFVSKSCPGLNEGDAEPTVRGPTDVQCNEKSVTFTVRTVNPFNGRLYSVGFENEQSCSIVGQNRSEISITLNGDKCGVVKTTVEGPVAGFSYNATLMIQFHPDVVTKVDQPLFINCFAPSDSALQQVASIKLPPATAAICSYTLKQHNVDNGCDVLDAKVGDNIIHKWFCELASVYNYLVHSCEAVTDKYTLKILDGNGCQVDPYVFETPVYNAKRSFVSRVNAMFKFPGVSWIQFRCKISICDRDLGGCEGVIPPNCDERAKREVKSTDRFLNTVTVESRRINVLVSDDLKPIEKLQYCSTYSL